MPGVGDGRQEEIFWHAKGGFLLLKSSVTTQSGSAPVQMLLIGPMCESINSPSQNTR